MCINFLHTNTPAGGTWLYGMMLVYYVPRKYFFRKIWLLDPRKLIFTLFCAKSVVFILIDLMFYTYDSLTKIM